MQLVHHAGHVEILPAEPVAVAEHHSLGNTFGADGRPYGGRHEVLGNRDFLHGRPQLLEHLYGLAHFVVGSGF